MIKLLKNLFVGVMGATPCWTLVVLFIKTWQTPMAVEEGRWVKLGVGIMVLEFILVHSGAFFGAFSMRRNAKGELTDPHRRIALVAGLVCFYSIFALGFSLAFNSWTLFWIFFWVTTFRFVAMALDGDEGKRAMMRRAGVSVTLYLVSVFVSIFVQLPRGGLTHEVLNSVYPNRGSGLWEANPQQALLAGMCYFGLLGLWELVSPFVVHRKTNANN